MLFTFPSRYSFTIGVFMYLALDRGRPGFPQDLRVPWYLGTSYGRLKFRIHGYHVLWLAIPSNSSTLISSDIRSPTTPRLAAWFRLFRFRSPLLTESQLSLFSSPYLDVSVQVVPLSSLSSRRNVGAFMMKFPIKSGRLLDSETAG